MGRRRATDSRTNWTAGVLAAAALPLGFLLASPRAGAAVPKAGSAAPTAARGYAVIARHCLKCHGAGSRLSDLDLSSLQGALTGGKHGAALVPREPEASRLFQLVSGKSRLQMPPTGALPDSDVRAIRDWIAAGAPYPANSAMGAAFGWWAFRPVKPVPPPAVRDPWVRNDVDAFVLARMKAAGVRPNPDADRATLIRRATFDLHGLPPTPEEVAAFVEDRSPNAWEKVVDRLLASPRYGERWARHWLDLARYAESEGFKADETRPNAWRYRDYVIESLNADKPYDRFLREQIAGDELYPDRPEALVATGFNRHWADESNARNIRLRRQEILNDITDTVGSVFLGLTVGCARCHDHKYDPISHKDYYRLQAFFAAVRPREDMPLVPVAALAEHQRKMRTWEERTHDLRLRIAELEKPHLAKVMALKRMPFTPEVLTAVDTPPQQRTALQSQLVWKVAPQLEIDPGEIGKTMKGDEKARWDALQAEMQKLAPLRPPDYPVAQGITDVGKQAPPVHTLSVGVYDQPIEEVSPGFLSAVDKRPPVITAPTDLASTGRRTALANWIASPSNPLTGRVMVNRVWQGHFGQGLVATPSDLGRTGELPTHPELLDYLASVFGGTVTVDVTQGSKGVGRRGDGSLVTTAASGGGGSISPQHRGAGGAGSKSAVRNPQSEKRRKTAETGTGLGWSIKALHRLLMTSATYRQSSGANPKSVAVDPENRLLWRYRRWRLEGEAIRDACLQAGGTLNPEMGGPSVFPELPPGVSTRGGWTVSRTAEERNRRSVYVFVRRNQRYPLFEAFDFPDTHEPCARRSVTNTAPQALMLFNSELALKPAQAMAGRLYREADSPEGRIERAYRLAFGREPETEEREDARKFLERQSGIVRGRIARKEPVAGPIGVAGVDPVEGAALVDLCHALFNANEFLYVE